MFGQSWDDPESVRLCHLDTFAVVKRALEGPRAGARHVSLVGFPDAVASTLYGIHDVLRAPALLDISPGAEARAPFHVEIVGEQTGRMGLASGVPIEVQRNIDSVQSTDIVIVPSVLLRGNWEKQRYPRLVAWIQAMHARGAVLCSACSGIFLLGETGLFDGKDVAVHYGYRGALTQAFPSLKVHAERVLVIAGTGDALVSSGASTTWHDLVLYLIARYAGATTAQEVARLFALQWHRDGLTPYMVFEGKIDHGDGEILSAQQWLQNHFAVARPVEEVIKRSKLAERTFKRRFVAATGLGTIAYVQRLRIEDAKRRLERTNASVEEISYKVGYEDAAFFRRLFRRTTGLAPGAYRKRFSIPEYARPPAASSRTSKGRRT
jgi:transcriptional regulator GlxA family with amidase domain